MTAYYDEQFLASQAMGDANGYTPTDDEIRAIHYDGALWAEPDDQGSNFDRWLAEHDRALSEKVWDQGYLRGRHPWTRVDQENDPIPEGVAPPRSGANANPYGVAAPPQPCPVYSCTLDLADHSPVTDPGIDAPPGSVWHRDDATGVNWPAPADGVDPPSKAEPQPNYSATVVRYGVHGDKAQRDVKTLQRSWVGPSWLNSLDNTVFEHRAFGAEIPFSGDLRPTQQPAEVPADWPELNEVHYD